MYTVDKDWTQREIKLTKKNIYRQYMSIRWLYEFHHQQYNNIALWVDLVSPILVISGSWDLRYLRYKDPGFPRQSHVTHVDYTRTHRVNSYSHEYSSYILWDKESCSYILWDKESCSYIKLLCYRNYRDIESSECAITAVRATSVTWQVVGPDPL